METVPDFYRLAVAMIAAPLDSLEVRRVFRQLEQNGITMREAAELLERSIGQKSVQL